MAVKTRSTPKKSPKSSEMSRKERHAAGRKERDEAFDKKLSILETLSKFNAAGIKENTADIKKNAAGIKKNAKRVDEIAERVIEVEAVTEEVAERVVEVEAVTEEITERVNKAEADLSYLNYLCGIAKDFLQNLAERVDKVEVGQMQLSGIATALTSAVNRLLTGQHHVYEVLTDMKKYSSLIAEAVIDLYGRSDSPPLPPIVKVCRLVLFICFVCGGVSFFYKPDGMPLWLHTLFIIVCEAAAFFVILLVLKTYCTLSKKNE